MSTEDSTKQLLTDAIADGAIGCRNCGDTLERSVSANGIVAPCEDCGDGEYSPAAPKEEALDAFSEYPTEEEAEATLRAYGTSGKEVVNKFIDRLLHERLAYETAIKTFIRDRGHHEGEHVFDHNACSKCDQSYIAAEAALDAIVSGALATTTSPNTTREAE